MPYRLDEETGEKIYAGQEQVDTGATGGVGGLNAENLQQLYMQGAFGTPGSTGATRYLTQMEKIGLIGEEEDEDKDVATGFASTMFKMNEARSLLDEYEGENITGAGPSLRTKLFKGLPKDSPLGSKVAPSQGTNLIEAVISDYNTRLFEIAGKAFTGPEKSLLEGLILGVGDDEERLKDKMVQAEKILRNKGKTLGIKVPAATEIRRDPRAEEGAVLDQGPQTPIDERSFWQRALNTGQESLDVPLPNLPYTGIGTLLGGLAPGGPLSTAAGAGIGKGVSNIRERGVPLTQEAAQEYKPTELLKPAAIAGSLDMLLRGFRPHKLIGQARGALAGKGGDVATKPITTGLREYVEGSGTGTTSKALQKLLGGAEEFYKARPKVPLSQLVPKKQALGKFARTVKGGVKSTVGGQFGDEERRLLRQVIRQASPGIGRLDDLESLLFGAQDKLGGLKRLLLPLSVGGGAGYIGSKLSGLVD